MTYMATGIKMYMYPDDALAGNACWPAKNKIPYVIGDIHS